MNQGALRSSFLKIEPTLSTSFAAKHAKTVFLNNHLIGGSREGAKGAEAP